MSQGRPITFVGGPLDGLVGGQFRESCELEASTESIKYRALGSSVWHLYSPVWNVEGDAAIYRYVGVVEEAKG